jgi:polysaccharide biosynthesis transport protein
MAKSQKSSSSKRAESQQQGKALAAFSPRSLLNMFLERWWIGLIVGVIAAAVFVVLQPKQQAIYWAEVQLLFEPKERRVLNIQDVVDTATTSPLDLATHVVRLRSESFLDFVQSAFTTKEVEMIQNAYRDPEKPNVAPPSPRSIIKSGIRVQEEKNTTILKIGMLHKDPEAAALIANKFARRYIDYVLDDAMTGTNSALLWLRNQAEEKRAELEAATRAMQDFRERHNMASVGENKGVIAQKVASLGQSLVQAELEQTNLRSTLETVKDFEAEGRSLLDIPQIATYGAIAELRGQLEDLRAQRILLGQRFLDEHPRMKDNALAIKTLEDRLKSTIELAVNEIRSRYTVISQHERRLREEFAQAEKALQDLDRKTDQYKFLESDYSFKASALTQIQSRLQELQIVTQLEDVNIRILDRANVPHFPINGTPKQIALQAAAIGVFLLFAIPLGLGFLDSRVKSPNDVEVGLEQVLLGGIKTMKKLSETERPNVFRLGKDDSLSEAYRGVFSEIEIRSVIPFPKRMLVTSSVPSEGKSLTASNLAAVFAAHGRKTLLVDCDFRRPTLRRYFGATAGVGLLPWLRENAHKPDVQIDTHKLGIMNIGPSFDLLPAGDAIKNPTEVIDQIASCDLFTKLSKHYDLIVVDTPPAAVFPDALLLSRFCSEMVYVCRFKTARKAAIKKTLGKFAESGIQILGVVLNAVPSSSVMNYGYDGYGAYNSEYYKSYQSEKVAS